MRAVKIIAEHTEDLLVRVAWEYYINNRDQGEIAKYWGVSRPTVSRMLSKARELGIVQISITSRLLSILPVEHALRKSFGLKWVGVVPETDRREIAIDEMARLAASYLDAHLAQYTIIGVGWGSTISHVKQFISPEVKTRPGARFVEMLGSFSSEGSHLQAYRVALALGETYGVPVSLLNVPAMTSDVEAKNQFLREPQIAEVLTLGRQAEFALVSVGSADHESTMYRLGYLQESHLEELVRKHAVGDMLARYFDINGNPVESSLDDHIISLSLDDLRRIPNVMTMALGENKVDALLGGIRGKIITHLVTDEPTAVRLLRRAGFNPPPASAD